MVNDLPVDAHELIALCAPRPVFVGAGATYGDGRVDAKGMLLAEVGAGIGVQASREERSGSQRAASHGDGLDRRGPTFLQPSAGPASAPNRPAVPTFARRYLTASQAVAKAN